MRLPVQLQRVMATEAEAGREARAKVGYWNLWKERVASHFIYLGNSSPGRAEGESGAQGGQWGHVRKLHHPPAQIPPGQELMFYDISWQTIFRLLVGLVQRRIQLSFFLFLLICYKNIWIDLHKYNSRLLTIHEWLNIYCDSNQAETDTFFRTF